MQFRIWLGPSLRIELKRLLKIFLLEEICPISSHYGHSFGDWNIIQVVRFDCLSKKYSIHRRKHSETFLLNHINIVRLFQIFECQELTLILSENLTYFLSNFRHYWLRWLLCKMINKTCHKVWSGIHSRNEEGTKFTN